MKNIHIKAIAMALAATFVTTAFSIEVSAAPRSAYAAKKAQCKQRANQMKFGVHVIKKNRWVKDCIAGAR
jgi:hypothetical protein